MASLTQRYVSGGKKVVVVRPNGKPVWWTLSKELPADDAVNFRCPLTGANGLRVDRDGFGVCFPASHVEARTVETEPEIDPRVADNLRLSLLHYDVPVRSNFMNPSARLRSIAIRLTESCWMVPDGAIPYHLIGEMRAAGCRVHVTKFDASESRKLIGVALETLRTELADAVTRAERSRDHAIGQMNDTETSMTDDQRAEIVRKRADSISKRVDELLKDVTSAARTFGISEGALRLETVRNATTAVQTDMGRRADAYVVAARAAREKVNTDIARAAETDVIPAGVLADALRDNGADEEADTLQDAFEVHTFSLVDVIRH
jgi:hypothetical protein